MDSVTWKVLHEIQSIAVDQERAEVVKRVDYLKEEISYQEFFLKYLLPNRPCVLGSCVTAHWKSVTEWVREDGQPDMEYLASKFGDAIVPVADCNKVQYYAQPKTDMKLGDYIKYWKMHISRDHKSDEGCLYLKDWHFAHVFPDYEAYKTPIYFTSDWLNEFWDSRSDRKDDDYRFVYMGPKGSWTPFHADVFRSFSWSANICGRKRWLLYPPGEEQHLKDNLGNLPYDVTSSELHDGNQYPNYEKACEPLEVIQEAGEVIFVPSGWHHQVFNLEDTISINHNWLNGCNIGITWEFLKQELCTIQKSISDCRDMDGWHSQCQLIMKASTGIDYAKFFLFLYIIASQRLAILREHAKKQDSSKNTSDTSHRDQTSCDDTCHVEQDWRKLTCKETNMKCNTDPTDAIAAADKEALTSETMCATESAQQIPPLHCTTSCGNTPGAAKAAAEEQAASGTLCATESAQRITPVDCNKSCGNIPDRCEDIAIWHALYDANQIKGVLECLMVNDEFRELDSGVLCDDPKQLYSRLCDVLKGYPE